jgi:hypothetical protein
MSVYGFAVGVDPDLLLTCIAEVSWLLANPTARPFAAIIDLDNGALALAFSPDRATLAVIDNAIYTPTGAKPPTIKLFDIMRSSGPTPASVAAQ